MRPPGPVASPSVSAERANGAPLSAAAALVPKAIAVAEMDLRKLARDPTELATRAIQPILWLTVFGQVMARARMIDTGRTPYIDFLVPGVLAQSVLFIAIFNGISVIWERDLGIVHKFLASPTPRAALVLGKALGGGARALIQALVVLVLGIVLGVRLNLSPIDLIGAALLVILGAMVFSSFSLSVACIVKTRERFMGVGQVLTMPLFFASNAIYPTSLMPDWLRAVARVNPLTYQIDGLRACLLPGGSVAHLGLGVDFSVLAATLIGLVALCSRLYPAIVR
ncbi:MAG TPA: ABC transporter permease [Steroidobacteraceae bacterium]|nr:ABC transporter permease [Steroidobacteraceae bacterium]